MTAPLVDRWQNASATGHSQYYDMTHDGLTPDDYLATAYFKPKDGSSCEWECKQVDASPQQAEQILNNYKKYVQGLPGNNKPALNVALQLPEARVAILPEGVHQKTIGSA